MNDNNEFELASALASTQIIDGKVGIRLTMASGEVFDVTAGTRAFEDLLNASLRCADALAKATPPTPDHGQPAIGRMQMPFQPSKIAMTAQDRRGPVIVYSFGPLNIGFLVDVQSTIHVLKALKKRYQGRP